MLPTTVKAESYTDTNGITYTYTVETIENEEEVKITGATIPTGITEIVIPGNIDEKVVTSIGCNAFYNKDTLVSITIPKEIVNIDSSDKYEGAFYGCDKLETIIFEDESNLQIIGRYAFGACKVLKNITIPSKVTEIGENAFASCRELETVEFQDEGNLTTIKVSAFDSCAKLLEIKIPSSVTTMETCAFSDCENLSTVSFGENSQLTNLKNGVFQRCSSLEKIKIPKKVSYIGQYTFAWCDSLKEITFEDESELKEIWSYAFQASKALVTIKIPANVTLIYPCAFWLCSSLESLTFEDNSKIHEIARRAFNQCTSLTTIDFGENSSLWQIDEFAFTNCTALKEIEIPSATKVLFGEAFSNCTSLTLVEIPESVVSIYDNPFTGCNENLKIACKKDSTAYNFALENNIDILEFEGDISYDNTALTNQPVTAIIDLNYKLSPNTISNLEQENWKYNSEELRLEKIYNDNTEGEETITLIDNVGNEMEVRVNITNIDRDKPTLSMIYTPDESTKGTVTAIVIANEPVIREISIIENGEIVKTEEWNHLIEMTPHMLIYTFKENTNIIIKVKDLAGNYSEETEIKIENIKSKIETPEIKYTPEREEGITNQNVIAEIDFTETNEEGIEFLNNGNEIIIENMKAKYEFIENGTYTFYYKDSSQNQGNITVEVDWIDKTKPEINVEVTNKEKATQRKEITITMADTLSGLSEQNEYKYCLSNTESLQEAEWLNYEIGETIEVGEGKTGEYYLQIKEIRDKAGNEIKQVPIKLVFDNTLPTILINNNAPEEAYEKAMITVEESGCKIELTKNGESIEYNGEILDEIGTYEIVVTDIAGNENRISFEIREYITFGKYVAYEEGGKWYLSNISPETKKEQFIVNLETNIEGIEVITEEQELGEGKYVGTGMKVTIGEKEYTIIVKGDIAGDGKANGQDALAILFHREGKKVIEGEGFKAADLNNDGKINGMDALLLLLHRERQEGYIL